MLFRSVVLDQGRLREVVTASCAMPGVLRPVELDGRMLVDGGWTESVPISAARQLGADFVIAVDVGENLRSFNEPRNALDIIARADYLARNTLNSEQLKGADVVLSPENGVTHWADFSTSGKTIKRGEVEVEKRIGAVKKALRKARFRHWLGWRK